MKWYVYETTNLINNKVYVGVHKGLVEDNYLGSGTYFQRALAKYKVENFSKLCIFVGRSKEITYWVEKMLVDEDFVNNPNTYNLKIGGHGGFDYLNSDSYNNPTHSSKHAKMMSDLGLEKNQAKLKWLRENDEEWNTKRKERISATLKTQYENGRVGAFKNKSHSEETKEQMRESAKGLQQGSKNSQFGTMWITNETKSKKIQKDQEIPDGWRKGRKIK